MASYKDWIAQTDINIDYYSAFIKAWIAFNSWYRETYKVGNDAEIIEKIKTVTNPFRTQIKNLLLLDSPEAYRFRNSIGELHSSLLEASINSKERSGVSEQITFTSISYTNTNTNVDGEIYNVSKYYLKRDKHGLIEAKIIHKNTLEEIFKLEPHEYNELNVVLNAKYTSLSKERKNRFLALYKTICPYSTKSILTAEAENITIGGIKFIKDEQIICVGIIEVLYLLRCSLMHGDVIPCTKALNVYRYAYEVLNTVLKRLE